MVSVPWQVRWKQPKLHSIKKRNNTNKKRKDNAKVNDQHICGAASSELTVLESDELIQHIQKETNIENISSQTPYILNIVISSSSKSAQSRKEKSDVDFHEPMYGDEFVLSLCNTIQKPRNSKSEINKEQHVEDTELNEIYSKSLRWPSSAFAEDNNVDERGIVSICFCRIKESALKNFGMSVENKNNTLNKSQYNVEEEDEDFNEKIADAMDTLHLLSLFDTTLSERGHAGHTNRDRHHEPFRYQDNTNQNTNLKADRDLSKQTSMKTTRNMDSEKKLVLCCLTNNGHIHLFVALDLLFNSTSSEKNLQQSFASLFLGNTIYQNLEKYVFPLSNPIVSIPLTMCRFYSQQKKQLLMGDNDDHTHTHNNARRKIIPINMNMNLNLTNPLDLTFFDATMDMTYYQYQTFANKATFCISSNDFIAVCGKGFRKRRHPYHSRKQLYDESPTENKDKNDNKNEEGGFISFISLRHCNETKSLFLPFAPSKITPVEWQGMQLFICFRDPKSQIKNMDYSLLNQLDKTDVIVIRADASSEGEHNIQLDSNLIRPSTSLSEKNKNNPFRMEETKSNDNNVDGSEMEIQSSLKSQSKEEQLLQHGKVLPLQRLRRFKAIPMFGSLKEILKSFVISLPSQSNGISDINDKSYLKDSKVRTLDINMNTQSTPPSLVAVHEIELDTKIKKVATLHNFDELALLPYSTSTITTHENKNQELVIKTSTKQQFFALLEEKQNDFKNNTEEEKVDSWCLGGQGWSLIGGKSLSDVYFVCWEGSNVIEGAYVQPLNLKHHIVPRNISIPTFACNIKPSYGRNQRDYGFQKKIKYFSSPGESIAMNLMQEVRNFDNFDIEHTRRQTASDFVDYELSTKQRSSDNLDLQYEEFLQSRDLKYSNTIPFSSSENQYLIQAALDSISEMQHNKGDNLHEVNNIAAIEKSKRLLTFCPSWNELEANKDESVAKNPEKYAFIVTLYCSGGDTCMVSLRPEAFHNPVAATFNQILAWLCQNNEYYTASAVALNLLQDMHTISSLHQQEFEFSSGNTLNLKHLTKPDFDGLLDGIIPLTTEQSEISSEWQYRYQNDAIKRQNEISEFETKCLSDMAVCCMVKAGLDMSSSFQGFLKRNLHYNADCAVVLLTAIATSVLSSFDDHKILDILQDEKHEEIQYEKWLWPIRCLLQVGIHRECMDDCLKLLNAAMPNELRKLPLAGEIVKIILGSTPMASYHLLSIVHSNGQSYWNSIDHDTRMVFSLLKIEREYPLLKQVEVQHWMTSTIYKIMIRNPNAQNGKTSFSLNNMDNRINPSESEEYLSTTWLRKSCVACLENAHCDWKKLIESKNDNEQNLSSKIEENIDDGLKLIEEKTKCIRSVINYQPDHPIDFGILIPTLLELKMRLEIWQKCSFVSTQELLNEICYAAGRNENNKSHFQLEASYLMQQCALAGNIMAAANLISGKDGLILECCDVLMKCLNLNVEESQQILFGRLMIEDVVDEKILHSVKTENILHSFQITEYHRIILRLLDNHVLSINKYGEFEINHTRGKINPIFAGRIIFRAWFNIVKYMNDIDAASTWMTSWLSMKLNLNNNGKRNRLASAALVRILIWPQWDEIESQQGMPTNSILAEELRLSEKFLTQLANLCCGMVECLPRSIANQIAVE